MGGWDSSVAWTVHATWGQATLQYLRYELLPVVLMRIHVFWVVQLCLCIGGSQHFAGDINLQNIRNHLSNGTASHPRRPKYSLRHLLRAYWDTFPQKVVSRTQEGSTIALCTNYNVRVLECCTIMWPPAISHICCQHHQWVYKQPWYIMLKYGSLQRENMATSTSN
jgi:hypothetical protein